MQDWECCESELIKEVVRGWVGVFVEHLNLHKVPALRKSEQKESRLNWNGPNRAFTLGRGRGLYF